MTQATEIESDQRSTQQLWIICQMADASFPTGAFAHSSGLEAARQLGEITTPDELRSFLLTNLAQVGRGAVPFVNEAHRRPDRLAALDQLYAAYLRNPISARASRSQGLALFHAATSAFALSELRQHAEQHPRPLFHLPVVFGAVARTLGLTGLTSIQIYLYTTLRDLLASAVRLNVIGPTHGQSLQFQLGCEVQRRAITWADGDSSDYAQTAPVLEILQGMQDRLYTRLFQS